MRVKKVSSRRASSRHGYPDCILVGTQGFVSAYWAARVRGQKCICVDISAVAAGMMTFVVMKQSINTPAPFSGVRRRARLGTHAVGYAQVARRAGGEKAGDRFGYADR